MILSTTYPSVKHTITSHFHFSPVKRRLFMLSQVKSLNNYYSRLLVLPILFCLLAAFSFTHKNESASPVAKYPLPGNKMYTIVIDAGHGGTDAGAMAADGTLEKDIVLDIAKKIRQLNTNGSIHIELSRATDVLQPLRNKVDAAVARKPDAFISLHVNKAGANNSGFDVYVSRNASGFTEQSRLLGTVLSKEIQEIYPVAPELQVRAAQAIWVLDAPSITYPAVLIECGNIDNPKDLSYITDPTHQNEIATQILKGIEDYVKSANAP
jgi:N-acetylmuramoyl-L-alanine amidase